MVPREKVHIPELVSLIEGLEVRDKLEFLSYLEKIIKLKGIRIEGADITDLIKLANLLNAAIDLLQKIEQSTKIGDVIRILREDTKKVRDRYSIEFTRN